MPKTVLTRFAWIAAFVATVALCFWPLLSAGFLFDDFANLPALGEYGPIKDFDALARYLTAGIADPLGRPVAMASFLLDSRDWPAAARPFLRTNIILHAINGLLLLALLRRLGRALDLDNRTAFNAALWGAALWCLHPLWVSTVGYVVQRHAMLASTFVLLGLLAWLSAVAAFREGRAGQGWLWAACVMPACGVLAALSKANGMLLPVLVLAIQWFVVMPRHGVGRAERLATWLLLGVPSLLLVAALLAQIEAEPPGRSWTLAERLMSQPRALADYLWTLLVPRVNSTGIFADGFQASTGWLTPASTLPAALGILALLVAPFLLRHRQPALAAALAFYLAGHLMESTVLPLELYFEHRNYLPAMLLAWALAMSALSPLSRTGHGKAVVFGLGAYLLVLGALTQQRAMLWADTPRQAAVWGLTLPDSPRAQTWAAQHELRAGNLAAAHARLVRTLEQFPHNPMLALNLVNVECAAGGTRPGTLEQAARALARTGLRVDMNHDWLRDRLLAEAASCPGLDKPALFALVDAALEHGSRTPRALARRERIQGLVAVGQGDCPRARQHFSDALRSQPRDSSAYGDTALLASHCGAGFALSFLRDYRTAGRDGFVEKPGMPRLHRAVLDHQGYWTRELDRLETLIARDIPGGQDAREQAD
ncbi:tetratricopeptide repeat protein [Arenimonas donghaensis]|uniref:tetratricopeptide repeat protein n=1 Tax=Arenimonas donghaensis TaxID=375061 RepID=UPI001268A07D|nr:tetratricopeptide repeat protein [Arenimonas donghaensis]